MVYFSSLSGTSQPKPYLSSSLQDDALLKGILQQADSLEKWIEGRLTYNVYNVQP